MNILLKIIFFSLTAIGISMNPVQSKPCGNGQNADERIACSREIHAAADKRLNRAYKQRRSALNTRRKILLRDAQRAWIKYRDKECAWEANLNPGGDAAALSKISCLAALTNRRADDLKSNIPSTISGREKLKMTPLPIDGARLSHEGYGFIRFGTSPSLVAKILGEEGIIMRDFEDPKHCFQTQFDRYPGVSFMVVDGRFVRADTLTGVINILGISVGDTLESVRAKNPQAVIEPHKYFVNGHNIILKSGRPGFFIVAEENEGQITSVRAGKNPFVLWSEGCL